MQEKILLRLTIYIPFPFKIDFSFPLLLYGDLLLKIRAGLWFYPFLHTAHFLTPHGTLNNPEAEAVSRNDPDMCIRKNLRSLQGFP